MYIFTAVILLLHFFQALVFTLLIQALVTDTWYTDIQKDLNCKGHAMWWHCAEKNIPSTISKWVHLGWTYLYLIPNQSWLIAYISLAPWPDEQGISFLNMQEWINKATSLDLHFKKHPGGIYYQWVCQTISIQGRYSHSTMSIKLSSHLSETFSFLLIFLIWHLCFMVPHPFTFPWYNHYQNILK